jgi:hypothetical protein
MLLKVLGKVVFTHALPNDTVAIKSDLKMLSKMVHKGHHIVYNDGKRQLIEKIEEMHLKMLRYVSFTQSIMQNIMRLTLVMVNFKFKRNTIVQHIFVQNSH